MGGGEGGREESQSAQSSIRSWKATFPTHWGYRHPPQSQHPLPTNRTGQPHHLCVLPASPSVSRRLTDRAPEFSRVVPPLAVSPLPTRRPPAGAKVFSTRRRKDAGPGRASQAPPVAYLKGGRGLSLQPSEWTEPQTRRRGKEEAGGPLYRPAGESSLSAGPHG